MTKFQKQRPAPSVKRMMNLLFQFDTKEEILQKLNRFCEHRDFYFISCDRKKKNPNQLDLFNGTGDNGY